MTRVSLVLRISPLLPSHLYHLKSRGQRRRLVVSVCVILLMHGVFALYIIFLRTFLVCRQSWWQSRWNVLHWSNLENTCWSFKGIPMSCYSCTQKRCYSEAWFSTKGSDRSVGCDCTLALLNIVWVLVGLEGSQFSSVIHFLKFNFHSQIWFSFWGTEKELCSSTSKVL